MLVIWTRYLIGFAFIPSGLKKLVGERFTQIPVSNPIGFFFEALYQSGIYWNFLGFIQVLAAFLLMTQRFGTVYITFLLVVASTGLLLWDFPKWKSLLKTDNFEAHLVYSQLPSYTPLSILTGVIFFVESLAFSIATMFFKNNNIWIAILAIVVLTAIISAIISFKNERKSRLGQ